MPCRQKFSYGVVCAKGDFDVSAIENLRDGFCFSAYVCELNPLGLLLFMFVPFLVLTVIYMSLLSLVTHRDVLH